MNRRKFIKTAFWGVTGISVLSGLYAWQVEPFWLEFVKVKMPVKNLPDHLVGKTLMQISDIHIGKRFDHQFIIDSFNKAKELNPDYVVYTGDYISMHKETVPYQQLEEVMNHVVKGKHGTIGILGNHDYGLNWEEPEVADKISEKLSSSGMHILRNESVELNGLNFIGFDDYYGTNFNPDKAINSFDSSKATIALCHNPDVCDLDVWRDYNSWILAGHTHGGQVRLPFLSPPVVPVRNKRYTAGQFELSNNRTLYINRATGHLYQVRFNVRPEITVFELQNA